MDNVLISGYGHGADILSKETRLKLPTGAKGGVPREQWMLEGHLPRVIYHQLYWYTKILMFLSFLPETTYKRQDPQP